MLEIPVDNIFVQFVGQMFKQTIGITMRTGYVTLLPDIFINSYGTRFYQGLPRKKRGC